MGVDLDWGLAQQQPNFAGNFLQTYQAGRQVGLEKRGDNALARVQTNPGDQAAFTDLALYAPDKANALLSMQAAQRAGQAREAASNVVRLSGAFGSPQPQQPAPQAGTPPTGQAAPGQPPQGSPAALDPSHPIVQQVGAAASAGQLTPADAWAALYKADPTLGDQMMTAVGKMDEQRRARATEMSGAFANAAQSIKTSIPWNPQDPQGTIAARQKAALAQLPQLEAHGVTPQMLQQQDYSDTGLNGVIGQSVGALGMMEQANKTRQIDQVGQQIAETGRHNQAEEATQSFTAHSTAAYQKAELNKPLVVPFGSSLERPSGQVISDGMGGGGGEAWTTDKLGQVVSGIPGAKITSGVRSPEHNAEVGGVPNSQHIAGTALDFVAPGMTLDQVRAQFAKAGAPVTVMQHNAGSGMHFHVQAAPAGGGGGGMMDALKAQATQIASYRMPPPTGRAATSAQGVALMQMVSQIDPDYDATKYHEKNASLLKFATGPQANTVRSINVAVEHLDQLQQAADALGNGNIRAFNGISNAFSAATGHPIPTNFDAIKNFVTDEVTKAIIGGGGGVGDREHAASIIARSNSPQQLSQAISQIQGLMGGQLNGLERQYKGATGLDDFKQTWVSPRAQQVLAAHQPKQPPAGATQTATGPNGQKVALVDGKWVGY